MVVWYFCRFDYYFDHCVRDPFLILAAGSIDNSDSDSSSGGEAFTGEYSEGLPIYKEIKGRGPFSDEIAQYAVGAAVKYKLLPSVILSQYGYESAFGTSPSARNDLNFLGLPGLMVVCFQRELHEELVVLKVAGT